MAKQSLQGLKKLKVKLTSYVNAILVKDALKTVHEPAKNPGMVTNFKHVYSTLGGYFEFRSSKNEEA